MNTQRFGPHSKGDDTRPEKVVALLKEQRDPITLMEERLSTDSVGSIRAAVEQEVKMAFETAMGDPIASMEGRS
ncbi:hypothetical protein EG834_14695 [bacterium]|nr:hypothetical protein [bacterium]